MKIHYDQFMTFPADERFMIEKALVKTCFFYFNSGDSIPVSMAKTYKSINRKRLFSAQFGRTLVTRILRANAEMQAAFDGRTVANRLNNNKWIK